ncbi:FtsX-like permease family protein [Streptomyces sp. NBC_00047]|uniref:FtsX-like permease family protein n=1 Tax=Streptomyces sp. NBC_00047 TaxID=2975627 RepID=UPI00224D0BD1|nr:FtsX-like permease family protein [Streptomyces sp. NBC_00047]MCX5611831.1 FtsX-like permease family protein [Streptomyces sp. NBC_00047]
MMLRYALQTVRDRKAGFLGAFVALLCAAALVTACGTLLETGLRGKIGTERYAATPVLVSADQNVHETTVKEKKGKTKTKHKAKPVAERAWLPAATLDAVRAVPGVERAVPELTFQAVPLVKAPGEPRPSYGHAWTSAELTPFTLAGGRAPRDAGEVVIDRALAARAGLTAGSELTVQSTGEPKTYRVSGIATTPRGDLVRQSALFFSDAEAQRLAARDGQVSAIGVLPRPGTDPGELAGRVEQALKGTTAATAQVGTGDERGPVEFLDAAGARTKLVSMGGAMGGTSLLVAILVVVGTFALSVQQRHRELALLRAIAATPRQLRRMIGREALLVGLAAGVTGAFAGLPLAAWLYGRFIDSGVVPPVLERTAGIFPMFAAVAASLLGAWAAARITGRRIARIRPAEALAEAALEPRRPAWIRTVLGMLLLAGGAVLVVVLASLRTEPASTPVTFLAVVVLAGAVSLLGPLLVRGATALLAGPLRLAGAGGHLATANLRGNSTRMASAVTPLALLVGMTSTVLFITPTLGDAARAQARDGVKAGWVLAAQGPGVSGEAAERIRRTPGVTAATEIVQSTVRVGLAKYDAQGVTPTGLTRTWDPAVTAGSLDGFGEGTGTAAVSELAADQLGLKPGSALRLTLGDGTPVTLTVSAVYARGLGFGDLTLPHALVAAHVDNPLAAGVLVAAEPGTGREQLAAAVRAHPGVAVLSARDADEVRAERQAAGAEINLLAMGLVLAFTAIAVMNTLAMSTAERVREFAMLRLAGAKRRQVLRMLRAEALAVVLIGAVLGSGIALAVLTAFSVGMTGAAAPAVLPVAYAVVVGVAGLLALAATALPGRVALRVPPVDVATP